MCVSSRCRSSIGATTRTLASRHLDRDRKEWRRLHRRENHQRRGHGDPHLCRYQRDADIAPYTRAVLEAPLDDSGSGLAPAGDGWFVVNVRDAAWLTSENGEKKP